MLGSARRSDALVTRIAKVDVHTTALRTAHRRAAHAVTKIPGKLPLPLLFAGSISRDAERVILTKIRAIVEGEIPLDFNSLCAF